MWCSFTIVIFDLIVPMMLDPLEKIGASIQTKVEEYNIMMDQMRMSMDFGDIVVGIKSCVMGITCLKFVTGF